MSSARRRLAQASSRRKASLAVPLVIGFLLLSLRFPDVLFPWYQAQRNASTASVLYWVDSGAGKLQSANLGDAPAVEDAVAGRANTPVDIAIDTDSGKVYWAASGSPHAIRRADLDGGGVEDVIVLPQEAAPPLSVALDTASGRLYWSDADGGISRASLDGTGQEVLVEPGSGSPISGLALDVQEGQMYWTDRDAAVIRRADLDGGDVETVVALTGPGEFPRDLELDSESGWLYWTTSGGQVQRSDPGGGQVQGIVTGDSSAVGVELDPIAGKLYWTEFEPGEIKRASLDGSGVETVVSGLLQPRDLVLGPGIVSGLQVSTPQTSSASVLENNSLIVRVEGELDVPGQVFVEYRDTGTGEVFRSRTVSSQGAPYVVHLGRLRFDTRYEYQVFGVGPDDDEVSEPVEGTFVTGSPPEGLEVVSHTVRMGAPTHDLTLMDFNNGAFNGMVAIDGQGNIVWYYDTGDHKSMALTQKPNHNVIYIAEHEPSQGFALVEVSPLGEEVRRLNSPCRAYGPFHHDVRVLPDGRVMFMSREIQPFGDPPVPQLGDTMWIWDQVTGEAEMAWSVFDFVTPDNRSTSSNETQPGSAMWSGCSPDVAVQDWTHGNAFSPGPEGNILYSPRHLNQIISIAPDFQSVQWRLGGLDSDFEFPDPADRFYHQHSPVQLPSGNILLFDNGNGRPLEEGGEYSRALELELDFDTMEARKVWEYRHDPDAFASCCSSVQRLDNGNTLLVFGSQFHVDLCCRTFTIVEADEDGEPVWIVEQKAPYKEIQYRVYALDSIMGETRVDD